MVLDILIVDDTHIVRDGLRELLEEEGHRVEEASSGEVAIEKTRKNKYDIVFMDYQMDYGINGLEATRRIREINNSLPVYILSLDSFTEE